MYINIPGLRNSDEYHWQTIWEKEYPDKFFRINQANWEQPNCETWTERIEDGLKGFDYDRLILIGHSVGCITIVKWFERYAHKIKGALLVAPSDVEHPNYPTYITGFSPVPDYPLPFPSIVVASSNDHVVHVERARLFATNWGSKFIELQNAGHIEGSSGFGKWNEGLKLLNSLS